MANAKAGDRGPGPRAIRAGWTGGSGGSRWEDVDWGQGTQARPRLLNARPPALSPVVWAPARAGGHARPERGVRLGMRASRPCWLAAAHCGAVDVDTSVERPPDGSTRALRAPSIRVAR